MIIVVAPQESPRVVQLMSAPYNGDVVLVACPARFGLDLSKGDVGVSHNIRILGDLQIFRNALRIFLKQTIRHLINN